MEGRILERPDGAKGVVMFAMYACYTQDFVENYWVRWEGKRVAVEETGKDVEAWLTDMFADEDHVHQEILLAQMHNWRQPPSSATLPPRRSAPRTSTIVVHDDDEIEAAQPARSSQRNGAAAAAKAGTKRKASGAGPASAAEAQESDDFESPHASLQEEGEWQDMQPGSSKRGSAAKQGRAKTTPAGGARGAKATKAKSAPTDGGDGDGGAPATKRRKSIDGPAAAAGSKRGPKVQHPAAAAADDDDDDDDFELDQDQGAGYGGYEEGGISPVAAPKSTTTKRLASKTPKESAKKQGKKKQGREGDKQEGYVKSWRGCNYPLHLCYVEGDKRVDEVDETETEGDYEVQWIVDEWGKPGAMMYLVKWKGYELNPGDGLDSKGDWEPEAHVKKSEAFRRWRKGPKPEYLLKLRSS